MNIYIHIQETDFKCYLQKSKLQGERGGYFFNNFLTVSSEAKFWNYLDFICV